MRLFISIPLPETIKKELAKIRKDFSEIPAKWVEEENLHITLVFLGETKETEATKATEAIKICANGLKPVNLKTDGLLLLPNEKDPHILAVKLAEDPEKPNGLGAGTEKLSALAEKIKKALRERKINFDEKPFRPHVTLARLKRLHSSERRKLVEKARTYKLPEKKFKVRRVALVESKLTPVGPVYFVVAKVGFR